MPAIEFKFELGQKVMIREIQRPGVVDLLQFDNFGKMCRVAYWDSSERKSTWLYEWELEAR